MVWKKKKIFTASILIELSCNFVAILPAYKWNAKLQKFILDT